MSARPLGRNRKWEAVFVSWPRSELITAQSLARSHPPGTASWRTGGCAAGRTASQPASQLAAGRQRAHADKKTCYVRPSWSVNGIPIGVLEPVGAMIWEPRLAASGRLRLRWLDTNVRLHISHNGRIPMKSPAGQSALQLQLKLQLQPLGSQLSGSPELASNQRLQIGQPAHPLEPAS